MTRGFGAASCLTCQKPGYPGAKFYSPTECLDCANERGRMELLGAPELERDVMKAGGGTFAPWSADFRRDHDDGDR